MAVKAKLVQGGDGTAIPAGMVGETKRSTATRGFSDNGATNTGFVLNGSFSGDKTLTPGKWRVDYSVEISTTSGASTGARVGVLTTDSTDGWIPSSNLSGAVGLGNMGYPAGDSTQSSSAIVTVTSSGIVNGTGFDLYLKLYAAVHTTFTGTYNGTIIATRIA